MVSTNINSSGAGCGESTLPFRISGLGVMDSAQLYAMKERLEGLRSYEATDIEKLARLLGTARAWPPPAPPSPDDLLNRWERRQVKPERDFMVLPGDGEDFVA